jgi:hypothetical protein|tara:strand:- start:1071 stop:1253 length:183 start_codon:yes stop_codon:yes gene_type:complete
MSKKRKKSKNAPKITTFPDTPTVYSPGTKVDQPIDMKTSGIKMRGVGAATKGTMSRGPMA